MLKRLVLLSLVLFNCLCASSQDAKNDDILDFEIDTVEKPEVSPLSDTTDQPRVFIEETVDIAPLDTALQKNERVVTDSVVERLKTERAFQYANDPEYWKQDDNSDNSVWMGIGRFFASRAWRVILYTILIGVALFVLYRVVVVNRLHVFYSRGEVTEDGETKEEIFSKADFQQRASNAESAGDFRSAIRFNFLATLASLHEAKRIVYHKEAPNHEYVRQLHGTDMSGKFGFLARIYDYIWYGEFTITETQYKLFRQKFADFNSTI
jgi:hypothetical protein